MAIVRTRLIQVTLATAGLLAGFIVNTSTAEGLTTIGCAALTTPVYQAVDPSSQAAFLSPDQSEALAAAKGGYTDYLGIGMRVSHYGDLADLTPVHRMYSPTRGYTLATDAQLSSAVGQGFTDEGVKFYAATVKADCTQPVTELTNGGLFRFEVSKPAINKLVTDGWSVVSGVPFYVAADPTVYPPSTTVGATSLADPATTDHRFTFAVIPDTQGEMWTDADPRMAELSGWLVSRRASSDIRFAVQVGDLVDWDSETHAQYQRAVRGLAPLEAAGFPYFLNIGNHDSQATCTGGGACDPRFTRTLARMTGTINTYFSAGRYGVQTGAYEPGKLDNTYTTIGAGGRKWLLLNLELWPRKEVVAWAAKIVAANPHHNVIIATHAYLTASGSISTNPAYGSTSPKYLFDKLIRKYKNIKIVICGHAGTARTRIDKGIHGNKIYTFLTCYHSNKTNPVRMIRIDTAKKTLETWVYAPHTQQTLLSTRRYKSPGYVS